MYSLWLNWVASIYLFRYVYATPVAHVVLEPVSDHDWPGMETRHTLMRRTPHHAVALQQREHFVWGGPDNGNGGVFANMTLDTSKHENKLVLSMDRFAGKLKEVDCSSNMMMKFTSNDTYADAIHQWDWVNFNEHRTFILIANYPGCAEDNTREPWIVSNVRNDHETLTVHLDAKKSSWGEVTNGVPFKVNFGQHSRRSQSDVDKRGLFDFIDKATDKVSDVVDDAKDDVKQVADEVKDDGKKAVEDVKQVGNEVIDKGEKVVDKVKDKLQELKDAVTKQDKQFTVNLDKSLPQRLFSKSMNGLEIDVACNSCALKGSVAFSGSVDFDGDGISSLVIDIEPRGVGIDVPITVTTTGVLSSPFNLPIDLSTIPAIPGLAVTGLFALGPTLQFDAGIIVSSVTGSITVTTGFSASLKDGAMAKLDVKSQKSLDVKGWDATGKPKLFKVKSAQVNVDAELYVSTGVYLEASVLDRFGGQAGLTLKAPVRVNVAGQYIANGEVCPNSNTPMGVELSGTAGFEVHVEAFAEVANKKKSFYDNIVVKKGSMLTLPPLCWPIGKANAATPSSVTSGDEGFTDGTVDATMDRGDVAVQESTINTGRPYSAVSNTLRKQASATQTALATGLRNLEIGTVVRPTQDVAVAGGVRLASSTFQSRATQAVPTKMSSIAFRG